MVAKKITSLQHPLVKHWLELRSKKAYREETQRVLITGRKMVEELPIEVLITSVEDFDRPAKEKYLVTDAILKKIAGHEEKVAAELPLPPPQDISSKQFIVILDQIADPGNLGTLLRTALALRWEGVIVTPGTVDLFNDKALRAAKGATFHLPFAYWTQQEVVRWAKQKQVHLFTADLEGKPLPECTFEAPLALVLSHEGKGPSPWAKETRKITIPMDPQVESLNVAASGAILFYTMRSR